MTTPRNPRISLISTRTQPPVKNTHRAIVESVDYSKIIIVASGDEGHCRAVMNRWLKEHDLSEFSRAYVTEIQYEYKYEEHVGERKIFDRNRPGRNPEPFHPIIRNIIERKYK